MIQSDPITSEAIATVAELRLRIGGGSPQTGLKQHRNPSTGTDNDRVKSPHGQ